MHRGRGGAGDRARGADPAHAERHAPHADRRPAAAARIYMLTGKTKFKII